MPARSRRGARFAWVSGRRLTEIRGFAAGAVLAAPGPSTPERGEPPCGGAPTTGAWYRVHRQYHVQFLDLVADAAIRYRRSGKQPSTSSTDAGSTTQGSSTTASSDLTASSTTAFSNAFQQLASDIQAMLVQAQNAHSAAIGQHRQHHHHRHDGTTTAGTGTIPPRRTTAITPEQKLATDLEVADGQLQNNQSGAARPPGPGPRRGGHRPGPGHHHHHHFDDGSTTPSTSTASTTAASTTTASTTTASTTTASTTTASTTRASTTTGSTTAASTTAASTTVTPSIDQEVAQTFAADITLALQAYTSSAANTATSAVVA